MTENNTRLEYITSSQQLKRRRRVAAVVVLILAVAICAVTVAWYIYNTNSHTTDVHMAAGTSTQLQISDKYDGQYSYSIKLDEFVGSLNPVSTDKITGGFQQCVGYTDGSGDRPSVLANVFAPSKKSDYYTNTMFLRTNAKDLGVYISGMEFPDSDESKLLATALRVGLVVHEPGEDQPVADEYIFELSEEKNPEASYNTYNGQQGYVLDHSKTDGSVVKLDPLTKDNFAKVDADTGEISLTGDSTKICDLKGYGKQGFSTPVQVDVYIWLEGCDEDCTGYIGGLSLEDLAVTYAGFDN